MKAVLFAAAVLALFAVWLYREAGAPAAAPTISVARPPPPLPPLPLAAASLTPPTLPASSAAPPPLAAEERGFLTPP